LLIDYQGTVLLVSHDREFLNNVVTGTLVLEGNGQVKEYAGGYDDWLRQRKSSAEASRADALEPDETDDQTGSGVKKQPPASARPTANRPRKLSHKEQRELDALPDAIASLEAEQEQLHRTMADPAFFRQDKSAIAQGKDRLSTIETDLAKAYQRWEALEELR
jgi:ATP-binding cassette subfamily F protein uup